MNNIRHSNLDISSASSADFVRNFARYRELSANSPVSITHHGRGTHVLLGADLYEELMRCGSKPDIVLSGEQSGFDLIFRLAEWIDDGLIICGSDLEVQFVNRVAQAITQTSAYALVGTVLLDAFAEIAGSLMEVHARRTLNGRVPSAADIPSPFQAGSWLRFQSFPLGDRIVLKFRDITEDVRRHRLADVKETILQAMVVHGGVGYIRLSLRGTIDRVDAPFCNMVELSESRLLGVSVSDLVEMSMRPSFKEALENVLRGEGAERIDTRLLSNAGKLIRAVASIVQLRGAYGAEGAIVMLTPEVDVGAKVPLAGSVKAPATD